MTPLSSAPIEHRVEISVSGCDDSTEITWTVDPAGLDFLQRLSAAITEASEYGCQPTMTVKELER